MHTKRIIPCLDVKNGRVVKGTNFINLIDAGDPVEIAKIYNEKGADELIFLDITASSDKRNIMLDVVKKVAQSVFIPFTVGGGVRTIEDFNTLLRAGADKVAINSIAYKNPDLINQASYKFGSQCVVVAIDAKKNQKGNYDTYLNGGRVNTNKDAIKWAIEAEKRGAGEILLTSMDRDGTKSGYELQLTKMISESVNIPVIASGGAGKKEHFADAIKKGKADAVLAASLFHFGQLEILELKQYLKSQNISVRF